MINSLRLHFKQLLENLQNQTETLTESTSKKEKEKKKKCAIPMLTPHVPSVLKNLLLIKILLSWTVVTSFTLNVW